VQRLFTTFPSGAPGFGLLLLRLAVAAVLAEHAGACLFDAGASSGTSGAWIVGVLAAAAAVLLALGFLTPLSAASAAVIAAGLALRVLPSPSRSAFGVGAATFAVTLAAAALALLGPGGFSVDAALFGRREITIPPHPPEG
jgi:uncharacterized membrane protein YphA (DoxX/SURF4 family)